ncbi:uncharacterized protein LOC113511861 [Galleria mellonella]|uniref:Uncharacterized protein LOC113511861 n=1 Tax=Galleria mellonella TaxID=7137 RepID=A0ABM3MGL5_GALME|nr:uncharacterized protein LOC113511861 [Galleria mellonella]
MAQQNEYLDFSGLFKLDVFLHLDIDTYSYYEVGLKKYFAFSSAKELIFIYINQQGERFEKNYDWDFLDNPVYSMCFEPSGTWVLIISEQKVLLVPFLPLFIPQNTFDHKWSLSSVTVLLLNNIPRPTSVVWWLTKESQNIIIIGSKSGGITFYSLESQSTVGECKVSGEIIDLQICFDDSLDLLALLISSGKFQQWKLVLEHRSFGYNWLQQTRAQTDKDKRDSFMSLIKQLSKDKITFFIQGGSKDDNKSQTVEHALKPTEYLPLFRKGSNNWALTAQYVNGRHFLTAFELNEGTLILESPEEHTPSRSLRPCIKNDNLYIQGLWSQRLIYLLRKNELEVHSANFSAIQGDALLGAKREFSELWKAELIGDVRRAHLMSAKEPTTIAGGWVEPTFLCDLQLPRFNIEPCLIITNCGAYIMNTVCDPCEWLVGLIMRGGVGAERSAAALGAPVPALLRASADMLLSRGNIAPAHYLYSLSQSHPDGWIARLGVFGRLHELSMYKHVSNTGSLGNGAITIKLLAILLKMGTNHEEKFDMDTKVTALSTTELFELSSIAAAIGLWDLVPTFSVHRGFPHLLLAAIKSRSDICRGALNCLIRHQCIIPLLLEENAQWLFDFIVEKCYKFDTTILKELCLWLNPLQDQLRPIIRDMKQGITSIYTTRMLYLIATFMHVVCAIESRHPCPDINLEVMQAPETWKSHFTPKRAVSCGLAHWAVADEGNAKIFMTNTPVNTEVIGRVVDVACGRHHTLVLTENGVYAAGDNSFGQLGVGDAWAGGTGDAASAGGTLLSLPYQWPAPLVSLSAGHYHSAALDVGGRLYTWGWGIHGQLGLGTIDNQWVPQLVTKLQGRKVCAVGCGACHTVVLTKGGEAWAMGAGVFGQLGSGARHKSSLPIRVALPATAAPVCHLAVGYFHNLVLTTKGEVWCWGASPQQVRAAHARHSAGSPPPGPAPAPAPAAPPAVPDPPYEPHLLPQLVDTQNVRGRVVKLAAGWHHSCLVDNYGTIYSWGLNFDGQLGSGDRKQVQIPTEIKIRTEQEATEKTSNSKLLEVENSDVYTKVLVACGGDFTVFVDEDGKIYASGNTHLQHTHNEKDKGSNRVIMMKTTKRIIKIPANRNSNKFLFQPIDRLDIMFPFDLEDKKRDNIGPRMNPLRSLDDFNKTSWADDLILLLKPWISQENLSANLNVAAKLAYHNKMYADCLKLFLDNLKYTPQENGTYVTHAELKDHEVSYNEKKYTHKDELKIAITNIMSKRIKDISLKILNEKPYPEIDPATYRSLPCCCDELQYLPNNSISKCNINLPQVDLSHKAAIVIDKCISLFPIDTNLWEVCFRLSKDFYIDNNLSVSELETVLRKYMETNATTMAAAIMYSNDCAQYSEILTPKFYLNMCNKVLDTWG